MDLVDSHFSETLASPPSSSKTSQRHSQAPKRTASEAELQSSRVRPPKSVKRRAPQACQSCRTRKVRCNVAKHGAPCIHCRLDEVECVVGESKRKKRRTTDETPAGSQNNTLPPPGDSALLAGATCGHLRRPSEHVTHSLGGAGSGKSLLCISSCSADQGPVFPNTPTAPYNISYHLQRPSQHTEALPESVPPPHGLASPTAAHPLVLPAYIKPLPVRFGLDDVIYLQNKGALAIPDQELRNELLRSYAEYVHPFMPLLDWYKFVRIIDQNDGVQSVSLLLFQAVMFAGIATVEIRLLKAAGYSTRREARRAFFNKTRLLYDLDYEDDSITLIQALLLMTYWRESPNGRKETHHWIEVAVSLSHKIGLHRNPEESTTLEPWGKKLWKRIWWSAYIRDSQIALGTRRWTCMKGVDFDVPMLQLADFELDTESNDPCYILADCKVVQNTEKQRQLAVMCIEMAKLCMCISHILSVQYGATSSTGSTRTASMLFPESLGPGDNQVQASAKALQEWKERLPEAAQYVTPNLHEVDPSNKCLVLNCAFLHMFYYAALSSLHRSQLLPSTGMPPRAARSNVVDVSRNAVRLAATKITTIAGTLQHLDLVRYLPSPSITVLLPAIVIHLNDVLAPEKFLRRKSLQDFCKCMQIMAALRDMCAAADYSTAFLQAAIQKTEIGPMTPKTDEDKGNCNAITSMQRLTDTGLLVHPTGLSPESGQLAPPLTDQIMELTAQQNNGGAPASDGLGSEDYSQNLVFDAVGAANGASPMNLTASDGATMIDHVNDFELDFDSTTNLGSAGKIFNVEEGQFGAIQGEGGEFTLDTDWLMGIGMEGSILAGEEGDSAMF